MLRFETLKYKNFISVGNYWVKIDLVKSSRTIAVGFNGSGKSSVLDAICFVLFNKAFRNANKPELVNSTTNKDMLVELTFTASNKKYLIRRGIKPGIFEIIIDGVLLNQNADNRDYQSYLEKTILKMNYKTFVQVVILGSANFIPFMQLPAAARRSLIEDLLDIQVFSVMSNILKDKISYNKDMMIENENVINIIEAKIKLQNKHLKELKQNNKELKTAIETKINNIKKDITKLQLSNDLIKEEITQIDVSSEASLIKKIKELTKIKSAINVKQLSLDKEISFYANNDVCPTCTQNIDSLFKTKITEKKISKKEEIENTLVEVNGKYQTLSEQYENVLSQTKEVIKKQNQISINNSLINSNENSVKLYNKELQKLNEKTVEIKEDQSYNKELEINTEQKSVLFENRDYYSTAALLLKDGGIKTKIIKQYIPVMNKMINSFLAEMDLFVTFEFDENFNESIKDRTVDKRTYSTFSQGEKMRIDLALLFTWRAIAKMKNSSSTNIIFFDEILDGSLDASGIDEFIKILEKLTKENNIFIISHKEQAFLEKFPRVLKFEKVKGFSRVSELI